MDNLGQAPPPKTTAQVSSLSSANVNPHTYKKHVGPDGHIRSWGIYPYHEEGYEDVDYAPMMRKMQTQMIYNYMRGATRPETQFFDAVIAKKKRELKGVDLGDLTRRDFVLRIHMPEIKTPSGEDRVWRGFIVSGGVSLGVLQDKILAPLMGWVRNFHAHILTDFRDGAQFGPKNSGAIDMMHLDLSAYDFLNEDHYCLAHLVAKVGDAFQYEYDLGDHFRHDITVEKILPLEESYGRVQILAGSGICPMENGKGNQTWAEHIDTLTTAKPAGSTVRVTPAKRRDLLSEIHTSPNYVQYGWTKRPKSKFDPDFFDLAQTTKRRHVRARLGTKLPVLPERRPPRSS
ncbi:MYND-type domain-containing protein [Mycena chlorophos]|uniref:MYND-type domain-containing protein n=1 Tax=Mycena chlorophos TaxID=658473 RepID=A0A8H6SJ91_MYCCL|nr:MYND-type domain-containing protein [Mycena chlorophos]